MKLFFIVVFTTKTENGKTLFTREQINGDILLTDEEAHNLNTRSVETAKKKDSAKVNLFIAKGEATPAGVEITEA